MAPIPAWWEKICHRDGSELRDLYVIMLFRDDRKTGIEWIDDIHLDDTRDIIKYLAPRFELSCEVHMEMGFADVQICNVGIAYISWHRIDALIPTLLDGCDFPLQTYGTIRVWMLPYILNSTLPSMRQWARRSITKL